MICGVLILTALHPRCQQKSLGPFPARYQTVNWLGMVPYVISITCRKRTVR
jgi:hypothetical protein